MKESIVYKVNAVRFIVMVLILSFLMSFLFTCMDRAKKDISESVLRLHIIANSDSISDQKLKLMVRDRLIKQGGKIFSAAQNPYDAEKTALLNSDLITAISEDEVRKCGYNYKIRTEIGRYAFPQKNYGDITLPAGKYKAVRVIIGEGKGKNWWCVMYPPLCFVKGTVSVPNDSDAYLKTQLTEGEYKLIKEEEVPDVRLQFKLLEIFNKLKSK